MKNIFVAVTDGEWFTYLSELSPDEVNFWKPGGQGFGALTEGELFLFKLRSPINKIVGGGVFVRSEKLPLSFAWEAFGQKNGASEYSTVLNKINTLRTHFDSDPVIGCVILNNPFFFPEDMWFDVPNFASNIPGRTYDTESSDGRKILYEIESRLRQVPAKSVIEKVPEYGKRYLVNARLGQGGFKVVVTGAYKWNCSISGEKALPVLEAAHIKPYKKNGPSIITNGLLLRSDLHILFDRGYLTITPD